MKLALSIGILTRYLATFFVRRVLSAGLFRNRLRRAILLSGLVVALAAMSLVAYVFLRDLDIESAAAVWLLRLAGVTSMTWVIILFMFVKVLFAKSDEVLALTFQLPVTNRVRM
ncbi:hypothetical protein [Rothia uropygialis]|uniref:hypothetical protein n=1 Tax=Kocuria sp. 36 TaxID=1415402 RepID=UPI00101D72D6|nr:hypothetical protein [Kocuria sp. 36]